MNANSTPGNDSGETPRNDLTEVRAILFDTIRAVRNKTEPMPLDRARTIGDLAGKLIDTAKVEIGYLSVVDDASPTGFIPTPDKPATLPNGQPLPQGMTVSTVHRLRG